MLAKGLIAVMDDLACVSYRHLFKVSIRFPIEYTFVMRNDAVPTVLSDEGASRPNEPSFAAALAGAYADHIKSFEDLDFLLD